MKAYGSFCPVSQALDLIGDRWTLLVIRELLAGSRRFGEILNGLPRMPRSVLASRLAALEETGLVSRANDGDGKCYEPTAAALALEPVVMGLGAWARRWAHRTFRDDELDPTLLMWDMQRRLDAAATPDRLVVVRFEFREPRGTHARYWMKIDGAQGEVCLKNPGLEETLVVTTTRRVLAEVWMGHRTFAAVLRSGEIRVEGPAPLARSFPRWFRLNVFVELERARPAGTPAG